MFTIDATCPLVSKVHNEARRFAGGGRQLVLIGHAGHDEVEGTLGTVPGTALVSAAEDVAVMDLDPSKPTAFITQTTLATDEVKRRDSRLGSNAFPTLPARALRYLLRHARTARRRCAR